MSKITKVARGKGKPEASSRRKQFPNEVTGGAKVKSAAVAKFIDELNKASDADLHEFKRAVDAVVKARAPKNSKFASEMVDDAKLAAQRDALHAQIDSRLWFFNFAQLNELLAELDARVAARDRKTYGSAPARTFIEGGIVTHESVEAETPIAIPTVMLVPDADQITGGIVQTMGCIDLPQLRLLAALVQIFAVHSGNATESTFSLTALETAA